MMLRRTSLCWLLALLTAAGSARAAAPDPRGMLLRTDRSEGLLAEGRRHLFSFRLPAAEQAFRRLAAEPDGAAAAYLHLSQSALLRGLMTGDEAAFDRFDERADTLRRLLEQAPRGPWRDYLSAESQLQRSLVAVKTGHFVRAAWAARSAYHGFERLTRAHPDFYEAYKGMGLLRVSIGSLPGGYRGLLKVLGFGGTVQGGLDALTTAAEHSRYNREEALAYGAVTRAILFRSEHASLDVLRQLHQRYPESPLFAHLYGFVLLSNRRAAEAEAVLRPAARRADDPAYCAVHYVDYYLADALYKLGRLGEAEASYRRYLTRHPGPALKAMANLSLGEALELQGRRADALAYYRMVEGSRGFDSDLVAKRRARAYLAAPLTARQRQLLQGRNAYDAGRYDEAVRLLTPFAADAGASATERAEASYRLGRVHHAAGRLDEAMRAYRYAVDHPGDEATGWAAWSQLFIGELLAEQGRRTEAAEAFRLARAYKGSFDYHQAHEQSVKAAIEKLEKGA